MKNKLSLLFLSLFIVCSANARKNVVFLYEIGYNSGKATQYGLAEGGYSLDQDPVYAALCMEFDVTPIAIDKNAEVDYELLGTYDCVVFSEAMSPNSTCTNNLVKLVGTVPVVSMKTYNYTNGRWSWAAPSNPVWKTSSIMPAAGFEDHALFKGLERNDDGSISLYDESTTASSNRMQGFAATAIIEGSPLADETDKLYATASGTDYVSVHEIANVGEYKYILVGMSSDNIWAVNSNGQKIIVNAVRYVMSSPSNTIILKGDMNEDGNLDVSDITALVSTILGNRALEVIEGNNMFSREKRYVSIIQLNTSYLQLQKDDSFVLEYTISPSDADFSTVIWKSSNDNVVEVDKTGLIVAKGEGSAEVTCSATDGSGVIATCHVDVTDRPYVDLGLPSGTLWATCNIGATSPEDYGDYFAWGETEGFNSGKTIFNWRSYKWCNQSASALTKYCNERSFGDNGYTDTLMVLELEDDAAYINWGHNWRIPSRSQLSELISANNTVTELTTLNGVNGLKITSISNGNYIFLPSAGKHDNDSSSSEGTSGCYFSINLYSGYPGFAYYLDFNTYDGVNVDTNSRCLGYSIRPVRASNQ